MRKLVELVEKCFEAGEKALNYILGAIALYLVFVLLTIIF
jgi:hypothetical protein